MVRRVRYHREIGNPGFKNALAGPKARIDTLEPKVAELEAKPELHDAGPWKAGAVYQPGAIVSYKGGGWICSTPHVAVGTDLNHEAFRLLVKSGRDAR